MYDLERGFQQEFRAIFRDANGNSALVDGQPVWTIDSTEFSLAHSEDGMSVIVQATGTIIGSIGTLTVDADADLGTGVSQITKSDDIRMVAGAAASIEFEVGEPQPITP